MPVGLEDLFRSSSNDVGFRTGKVLTWNTTTGANTIIVGGSTLTNVPVLTTAALPILAVGNVVGLLRIKNQYLLLGRVRKPPI